MTAPPFLGRTSFALPSLALHPRALRPVDADGRGRRARKAGVAALPGGGVEDERRLPGQVRRVDGPAPGPAADGELHPSGHLARRLERHLRDAEDAALAVAVRERAVLLRLPARPRDGVEGAAGDGRVEHT